MRLSKRNRLLLKVPIRKEEPAYALLGRLALRYGHFSLRSFANCVDLRGKPLYGSEIVSDVAALAGIDPNELAKWSPVRVSRHKYEYGDATFGRWKWILGRRRSCPGCIHDDLSDPNAPDRPWMCNRRFWWDFRAIDCCPIHRTWLLDACPKCKEVFGKDYTNVRYCNCGYDLASYIPEALSKSDCAIDEFILSGLLGLPHSGLGPLDTMPFVAAIVAISGLGSAEVLHRGEKFEFVNRERRLECKIAANVLFSNWPQNFHSGLSQRVAESIAQGQSATTNCVGRTYGPLYHWLSRNIDPAFNELRLAFEQHYFSGTVPLRRTRIFGNQMCPLSWTSIEALNAECDLPPASKDLYPFLRALGIVASGEIRRDKLRIPRSRIAELRTLRADSLSVIEAARQLGTPRSYVREFVKLGLIRSIDDSGSSHLISKSDLTRIMDATTRLPIRTVYTTPVGAISLSNVGRKFRTIPIFRIVPAILDGSVSVVGRLSGKSELGGLLVDIGAIRRIASSEASPEGLLLADAVRLLKFSPARMRSLIKLGYLKTCAHRGRKPARLTLASIRAFKSEYMTGGQAAKRARMSFPSMANCLREAGILEQAPGQMYFYRRTKRLYNALEELRNCQFASKKAAILSLARGILLEYGRPLRARFLAERIGEQVMSVSAPKGAREVIGVVSRPGSGFVRIGTLGYWIADVPWGRNVALADDRS
ncbi:MULTISPECIES: TniQ family protein [unclassified Bradyrhizobium]